MTNFPQLPPATPSSLEAKPASRSTSRIVRRNAVLIAAIVAVVVIGTGLVTRMITPMYESSSTLLIANERAPGMDLIGGIAALSGAGGSVIAGGAQGSTATEAVVLASRRLVEDVVDTLSMNVTIVEPQLPRSEVLEFVSAPRTATPHDIILALDANGAYRVRSAGAVRSADSPVAIGQRVTVDDVTFALDRRLAEQPPEEIQIRVEPFRTSVGMVQEMLEIAQIDRNIDILSIRFRHTDPVLSAAVPNVLSNLYIGYRQQTSLSQNERYAEFLSDQSLQYEQELREAEARLQAFQEATRLIAPETQLDAEAELFVNMRVEHDEVSRQEETLREMLTIAEAESRENGNTDAYREILAHPVFAEDRNTESLILTLFSLDDQRVALLGRRTPDNADVQLLTQRIRGIESQLRLAVERHIASLDIRRNALAHALSLATTQMESVPAQQVELLRLLREQKFYEQLYLLVQTKLKEAQMEQQETGSQQATVLDDAIVPGGPVYPRPALNLLIAMVAGLLLAGGAVGMREYSDGTVKSRQDVHAVVPAMPILGLIPHTPVRIGNGQIGNGKENGSWGMKLFRFGGAGESLGAGDTIRARWISGDPSTEAYRALRTNLALATPEMAPKVVVVTSPSVGEGKTATSANLAIALAQQGIRTLLVDADLRRGSLHKVLGVSEGPGLGDILKDGVDPDSVVQEMEVGNFGSVLSVLARGSAVANPAEMLGSARMRDLLASASERFERVIIDTPPLKHVTDAAALATLADTVILAARIGVTQQADLHAAMAELRHIRAEVGGVVLSGADMDEVKSGYPSGAHA